MCIRAVRPVVDGRCDASVCVLCVSGWPSPSPRVCACVRLSVSLAGDLGARTPLSSESVRMNRVLVLCASGRRTTTITQKYAINYMDKDNAHKKDLDVFIGYRSRLHRSRHTGQHRAICRPRAVVLFFQFHAPQHTRRAYVTTNVRRWCRSCR